MSSNLSVKMQQQAPHLFDLPAEVLLQTLTHLLNDSLDDLPTPLELRQKIHLSSSSHPGRSNTASTVTPLPRFYVETEDSCYKYSEFSNRLTLEACLYPQRNQVLKAVRGTCRLLRDLSGPALRVWRPRLGDLDMLDRLGKYVHPDLYETPAGCASLTPPPQQEVQSQTEVAYVVKLLPRFFDEVIAPGPPSRAVARKDIAYKPGEALTFLVAPATPRQLDYELSPVPYTCHSFRPSQKSYLATARMLRISEWVDKADGRGTLGYSGKRYRGNDLYLEDFWGDTLAVLPRREIWRFLQLSLGLSGDSRGPGGGSEGFGEVLWIAEEELVEEAVDSLVRERVVEKVTDGGEGEGLTASYGMWNDGLERGNCDGPFETCFLLLGSVNNHGG